MQSCAEEWTEEDVAEDFISRCIRQEEYTSEELNADRVKIAYKDAPYELIVSKSKAIYGTLLMSYKTIIDGSSEEEKVLEYCTTMWEEGVTQINMK